MDLGAEMQAALCRVQQKYDRLRADNERLMEALERIALLDEADGHELTWEHASRAVAIACEVLGKHPSQIEDAAPPQDSGNRT